MKVNVWYAASRGETVCVRVVGSPREVDDIVAAIRKVMIGRERKIMWNGKSEVLRWEEA